MILRTLALDICTRVSALSTAGIGNKSAACVVEYKGSKVVMLSVQSDITKAVVKKSVDII